MFDDFNEFDRFSWISIHVHWFALMFIDFQWLPSTFMDFHRVSLIFIDFHWFPLILIDVHRLSLIVIDCNWLSLIVIDCHCFSFSCISIKLFTLHSDIEFNSQYCIYILSEAYVHNCAVSEWVIWDLTSRQHLYRLYCDCQRFASSCYEWWGR